MLLPPKITIFFFLSCVLEFVLEVIGDESERNEIENKNGLLALENVILTFLEQGLEQHKKACLKE